MTHHKLTALDRYENELMHRSSQALASGDVEDSCEKLRLMCLSRGAGGKKLKKQIALKIQRSSVGLVALGRGFRRMDHDGNRHIDLEDFTKALRDAGFHLTDIEAEEVFNYFDKENSGSINMSEFLVGIRVRIFRQKSIIFVDFNFSHSQRCLNHARKLSNKRSLSWTSLETESLLKKL